MARCFRPTHGRSSTLSTQTDRTAHPRLARARHTARRVRQTVTRFDGGVRLLKDIAGRRLSGGPDEVVFRTGGVEVICPNQRGARVPVYEVFAEDAYRMDWFLGDAPDDVVAVDIGAHIGCFTVDLARRHPLATVHAYEASPATAAYLSRNVAANNLSGRVHVHQQAVAAEAGFIDFPDNAGASSLNGLTAPEGTATIEVATVPMTQVLATAGGDAANRRRRVDVVKIDTEGAEYDMVLGSSPDDWLLVERVVMEYHDVPGHGREELLGFFEDAGLREVAHEQVAARQGTTWLRR